MGSWRLLLPVAVFLCGMLVSYWPMWTEGKLPFSYDLMYQFYPFYSLSHSLWSSGQVPLWNEYTQGGTPLLGNPINNVLYPVNIALSFLLPATPALAVYSFLHFGLCFGATYWLLRSYKASSVAATFSAAAYTFCNYVLLRVIGPSFLSVFAWTPLALFFLEKARCGTRWHTSMAWIACAGLASGMMLLGGLPQVAAYGGVVVGTYLLLTLLTGGVFHDVSSPVGRLGLMLASGVLFAAITFGLAAPQLLPQIEYTALSNMGSGYDVIDGGLLPPDIGKIALGQGPGEIFTLYVGGAVMAFAAIGAAASRRRQSVFFVAILAGALMLSLREPECVSQFFRSLPGLGAFNVHYPERAIFCYALGMAVLAGLGLDEIARVPLTRLTKSRIVFGIALAVAAVVTPLALGIVRIEDHLRFVVCLSVVLAMVVCVLLMPRFRRVLLTVAIPLLVLDLLVGFQTFGQRFGSMDEYALRSPVVTALRDLQRAEPGRYYGIDPGVGGLGYDAEDRVPKLVGGNSSWANRLEDIQGFGPTHLKTYWDFLSAVNQGYKVDHRLKVVQNPSPLLRYLNTTYAIVPTGYVWADTQVIDALLTRAGTGVEHLEREFHGQPIASEIRVVSRLGNSTGIPQGAVVATIRVDSEDGQTWEFPMRAGVEVSESLYDRPGIAQTVCHSKSETTTAAFATIGVGELWYSATLHLPSVSRLRSIRLDIAKVPGCPNFVWHVDHVEVPTSEEAFVDKVFSRDGYDIWRFRDTMPRAVLVPAIELTVGGDAALERMQDPSFDPRRRALLYWGDASGLSVPIVDFFQKDDAVDNQDSAVVEAQTANSVRVRTSSSGPRVLVLAEKYYPAWKARVDGSPANILRVNYMFRGVEVPAGEHVITMDYEDKALDTGTWLGLGALLLVVGTVSIRAFGWRRSRDRRGT